MSEVAEIVPVQKSTSKKRRYRLIFFVVTLINVGILVLLWTLLTTPATHSTSDPLVAHAAPNFSLSVLRTTSTTEHLSLSDFKGKAVVLNFWASWCAPCNQEAPLLQQTWQQMQAQRKDVVFVGIDFQETRSTALSFLQQHRITYPLVMDASGSVVIKYNATSLPQTIFINREGEVVSREVGQLTDQLLATGLQAIL